ncbi:hypothetical protein DPMN_151241 [Dreissena polymorpha]|uniref:Uncharacterized protein n=1 Tax=Dreissena polymorpha TaxID=45954 RepID=A0A9D4FKT8_DREPO|nr:hypothetical protein DPMN_151241 [Dreissena polymorpha]
MLILEILQTTFKQTTNFPACKGLSPVFQEQASFTPTVLFLPALLPPDSHNDFDVHLVQVVQGLSDLHKELVAGLCHQYAIGLVAGWFPACFL